MGFKWPWRRGGLKPQLFEVEHVASINWTDRLLADCDFSGQIFEHLRMSGCKLTNCRFDRADLRDLRVWDCCFEHCSFVASDLSDAVLGAVLGDRLNTFRNVDFSEADLRRTVYSSAVFEDCAFDRARLRGVEFNGSRFTRCRFAGELRNVIFSDRAFRYEMLSPNLMAEVDFRQATLRWVEFRRLDLSNVFPPEDEDHVVISNVRQFLAAAVESLRTREDDVARLLRVSLEHRLNWAPSGTAVGLFNRLDLAEIGGAACVELFDSLVEASADRPTRRCS